jgi:hypothetical protein
MTSNRDEIFREIEAVNAKAKALLEPFDAVKCVNNWDQVEATLTDMIRMLREFMPLAWPQHRHQIMENIEYASELLLNRNVIFKQYVRGLVCDTTGPIYYHNLPKHIQQEFVQKTRLITIDWHKKYGTHPVLEQTHRSIEELKREDLRPYLAEVYGIVEAYEYSKTQHC